MITLLLRQQVSMLELLQQLSLSLFLELVLAVQALPPKAW